jgi:Right handed beta helix region
MRKISGIILALTLGVASLAQAQATRTWVSGVGDDANPCSRTAPCKTFAGAISKTAIGGMINAIDSAGFGAVTIGKAITIDATPFMGGVLQSGANGIIVNAPAADRVTLRGLDIEGVSAATNGIRILSAAVVTIENCQIFGFSRGISAEGTVAMKINVINTTIKNNTSHGIAVFPTGGTVTKINLDNVRSINNAGNGIEVGTNSEAYINRSNMSFNGSGGVVSDVATTFISVDSTTISGNVFGVFSGTAGASVTVLSRCMITKNTSQGVAKAGDGSGALGTITGFQSNMIINNTGDNTVTTSTIPQ